MWSSITTWFQGIIPWAIEAAGYFGWYFFEKILPQILSAFSLGSAIDPQNGTYGTFLAGLRFLDAFVPIMALLDLVFLGAVIITAVKVLRKALAAIPAIGGFARRT